MNKPYIITGAGGTGKTTLIDALRTKGHDCLPEVSRTIIQQEQHAGSRGMPWLDVDRFAQLVYTATLPLLATQPKAHFTDRSLVDLIAYLRHYGKSIPHHLSIFPFHQYYAPTVFFAPPWRAIYCHDPQRPEPFATQEAISQQLQSTYVQLGFHLIVLPCDTVSERVTFVEQYLS